VEGSGGGQRLWRGLKAVETGGSVDTVTEVPILEVLEAFEWVCESLTEV
jgi:hypothetical protein